MTTIKTPRNQKASRRIYIEGHKGAFFHNLRADFLRNKLAYLLFLPILIYYILFHYLPMGGLAIAFEDFKPRLGIFKSPFVGLQNFNSFFNSVFSSSSLSTPSRLAF